MDYGASVSSTRAGNEERCETWYLISSNYSVCLFTQVSLGNKRSLTLGGNLQMQPLLKSVKKRLQYCKLHLF